MPEQILRQQQFPLAIQMVIEKAKLLSKIQGFGAEGIEKAKAY